MLLILGPLVVLFGFALMSSGGVQRPPSEPGADTAITSSARLRGGVLLSLIGVGLMLALERRR